MAKKKKKKTKQPRRLRKKNQEREKTRDLIAKSQKLLLERTETHLFGGNVTVLDPSMAKEKMSDVIFQFADPLLEMAESDEEGKKALVVALLIWNLSLSHEKVRAEQRKAIDKMLGMSDEQHQEYQSWKEMVDFMLERKKTDFPDIHRMILNYDIIETPEGLHLNVTSTVPQNGA